MKKLETKIKKISIANIEGRLTPSEMEEVMAGSGGAFCAAMGFLFIPGVASGFNYPMWMANATACWNS